MAVIFLSTGVRGCLVWFCGSRFARCFGGFTGVKMGM